MTEVFIYDAVRTPRSKGKAGGTLNEVKPIQLGASVLNALRDRHSLDTSLVEDVIFGCVTPGGDQGADIAKASVMAADWSEAVPGVQLDRFCASGLEAVNIGAAKIGSGQMDLVVTGGIESMSRAPLGSIGGPMFTDPDFVATKTSVPQGIGADLIATIDGYTRENVDAYAMESQRRAAYARDNGWFDKSVITIKDENDLIIQQRDDFIKPDTDMQKLGALKPAFEMMGGLGLDAMALSKYPEVQSINHVHTAGNSSGIVDGAAAVLMGSEKAGVASGLTPRGRVVTATVISTDPVIMLAGPGPAAQKCLEKAGLSAKDIDIWEINEAFASVAMRYMKDLDIDHEITNVNGGAIAMGHPLGATGAMLISTVLDELERRNAKRAMVSLCVGGGMGISTLIERV